MSPNVPYTRAEVWPVGPRCPSTGTGSSPGVGGNGSGAKLTGIQSDACGVKRGVPMQNQDVPDV